MKAKMAVTKKDQWDAINYPELDAYENDQIRRARRLGYAEFFPCVPNGNVQARRTFEGATKYIKFKITNDFESEVKEFAHWLGGWNELRKVIDQLEDNDQEAAFDRAMNRD